MEVAQFVLDTQLLPGGRMPLRVFEPRYLRMVADAMAGRRPFGICMPDPKAEPDTPARLCPLGTLVEVVDFSSLKDGRLGIIVEGRQRYHILSSEQEEDKLHVAQVELLPNWPAAPLPTGAEPLRDLLSQVFGEHPELAELYPAPRFDDAAWLSARWLELLPLSGPERQGLIGGQDCQQALRFLCDQLRASSS
ncbi:LON peptidase substrate-binding domain-containing protein [Gallaecimonas kandeliae]|uniref:LON peptidase substrate-binding domain-containing protein n=1 Tax=Gallaecimonas kandeliae TaxID=3029055 RepID=UPI0026491A7A|nr:LON peptidase substrate-binding domain-containing protein [Gallaecimonas kandeliae]WKE64238.1 LON peptidase substrate-binding domain-containing protein [Gallaecimonas kandeliae]